MASCAFPATEHLCEVSMDSVHLRFSLELFGVEQVHLRQGNAAQSPRVAASSEVVTRALRETCDYSDDSDATVDVAEDNPIVSFPSESPRIAHAMQGTQQSQQQTRDADAPALPPSRTAAVSSPQRPGSSSAASRRFVVIVQTAEEQQLVESALTTFRALRWGEGAIGGVFLDLQRPASAPRSLGGGSFGDEGSDAPCRTKESLPHCVPSSTTAIEGAGVLGPLATQQLASWIAAFARGREPRCVDSPTRDPRVGPHVAALFARCRAEPRLCSVLWPTFVEPLCEAAAYASAVLAELCSWLPRHAPAVHNHDVVALCVAREPQQQPPQRPAQRIRRSRGAIVGRDADQRKVWATVELSGQVLRTMETAAVAHFASRIMALLVSEPIGADQGTGKQTCVSLAATSQRYLLLALEEATRELRRRSKLTSDRGAWRGAADCIRAARRDCTLMLSLCTPAIAAMFDVLTADFLSDAHG